jgi:hypothetical protein
MLMSDAHVGCGRQSVQDERDVLDMIHNKSSARTCQVSSTTGPSQSTLWENQLYPFPVQPVQGLNPGGRHLFLEFS